MIYRQKLGLSWAIQIGVSKGHWVYTSDGRISVPEGFTSPVCAVKFVYLIQLLP